MKCIVLIAVVLGVVAVSALAGRPRASSGSTFSIAVKAPPDPGGHPKSPSDGHFKIPQLER